MTRTLSSLVAITLIACGGTTTDSTDGGGSDASTTGDSPSASDVVTAKDSTPPTGDAIAPSSYDGTVGKACSTDNDCHSANGPNVARCSNTVWAPESYYPTPVCIIPSCKPISDTKLHFCDGPDDPSSPGVCVAGFNGGVCLPKCTYDKSGSATSGCTGNDVCFSCPSSTENGNGYCWGGCTKDTDCASGKCQVDQGICVIGVTPPTKNIGDACTKTDNDTLACYCLYGNNNTGYCSSFCIVGQNGGCPGGFVCDPYEYRAYGYQTSNTGMGGYCTKSCAGDAAACPSSASCTNLTASGPDCVPP